jgi:hypothetical protein
MAIAVSILPKSAMRFDGAERGPPMRSDGFHTWIQVELLRRETFLNIVRLNDFCKLCGLDWK